MTKIRRVKVTPHYIKHPEGSVLIEMGDTKVICNASIENRVPHFLRGQGKGWITAEYSMLPRATNTRNTREASRGKVSGRTMEIQRLIGRSLRSVVDLDLLGERTIWVDCDVIQADGGTRTASITGAFIAVAFAMEKLMLEEEIESCPLTDFLAAISAGVLSDGKLQVDLDYEADFNAKVDMNIVMTGEGQFVEIQGTGEEATFSQDELNDLLSGSKQAIKELIQVQKEVLGPIAKRIGKSE